MLRCDPFAFSDHDGMNNWQEWIAGTDPTDAASRLAILAAAKANEAITITWSSVTTRTYSVERASDLGSHSGFAVVRSGIAGQAGTTTFADTTAPGLGPLFYRVRVEQ